MKSHAKGGGGVSFDMTPMIDIVFNLIIFFMLVSQFYQMEVEPVKLPPAAKADPKKKELQLYDQVVINVMPPDKIKNPNDKTTLVKIGGEVVMRSVFGGDIPDPTMLEEVLVARKEAADRIDRKINVILRAGENVHYELIGRIMIATAKAKIPNWWVQAQRPDPHAGQDEDIKKFLGVSPTLE